jgi:hypothetical protein
MTDSAAHIFVTASSVEVDPLDLDHAIAPCPNCGAEGWVFPCSDCGWANDPETVEEGLFHRAMRTGTFADYDAWQNAVAAIRISGSAHPRDATHERDD